MLHHMMQTCPGPGETSKREDRPIVSLSLSVYIYIYIYMHTRTHIHMYIDMHIDI